MTASDIRPLGTENFENMKVGSEALLILETLKNWGGKRNWVVDISDGLKDHGMMVKGEDLCLDWGDFLKELLIALSDMMVA